MSFPSGNQLQELTREFMSALRAAGYTQEGGPYFLEQIPSKKLVNARDSYANYVTNRETPLFLNDGTVFGSAKRGVLLTDQTLYYAVLLGDRGAIGLDGVAAMSLSDQPEKNSSIEIVVVLGDKSLRIGISLSYREYAVVRNYLEMMSAKRVAPEKLYKSFNPQNDPFIKSVSPSTTYLGSSWGEEFMVRLVTSAVDGETVISQNPSCVFTGARIIRVHSAEFVFYRDITLVSMQKYEPPRTPGIRGHPILSAMVSLAKMVDNHGRGDRYEVTVRAGDRSVSLGAFSLDAATAMVKEVKHNIRPYHNADDLPWWLRF